MKDFSREERIAQLEKLISEKDEFFDKEQGKRCTGTFLVLSGAIYLIALKYGEMSGIWYLLWLIIAPIISGAVLYVSFAIVCNYIMCGAIRRVETLAMLKGELYELKRGKRDEEKAKQTKKELEDLIDFLKEIDEEYQYILDKEYEEPEEQLEELKSLLKSLHYYYEAVSSEMDEDI